MLGPTLLDYELYIYSLQDYHSSIQTSTLTVIHQASDAATVTGELIFAGGLRLHVREVIRFDLPEPKIASYGYEVWRGQEQLYWYDSQPHPHEPALAATHPHHKHIPPETKHHRVPAPGLSFTELNLPFLIQEIERLGEH